MNTMRVAAIALAALLVVDLGHGFAAVLCKNRGGGVVLREKCRKKETQLDLAQLGGVCPKGDPGPPGSGVRVVDANGKSVGPDLVGNAVMISIGNQGVAVRMDTAGFIEGGNFVFTSIDCSGQSYIRIFNTLLPTGIVIGTTLFYPVLPPQSVHVMAFDSDDTPTDCTMGGGTVLPNGRCCIASDQGTTLVSPPMTFDLATLGLVPPFQVQVVP